MSTEAVEEFDCFGSRCSALVIGSGEAGSARGASALARDTLLSWHERFSRFLPDSELAQLNRDPRREVPVRRLMARFAQAVRTAGALTGGLVDATLLDDVQSAGYTHDLPTPIPLAQALALAPPRAQARGSERAGWQDIEVDLHTDTVTRPPGLKLDSGGLAKGLFADALGRTLAEYSSFAINCAGDLTIGGSARIARAIHVESPFDGRILHTFHLSHTGVATSGIGRRSWLTDAGKPAHHLLDPSTADPAFTGIVQVTALAPSALMAEIRAKAAILSGPAAAPAWLTHGGVIVFDDGSHQAVPAPAAVTLSQLSGFLDHAPAPTLNACGARKCLASSSAGSGREMK